VSKLALMHDKAATDYLMEIFAEVRCGMKTAAHGYSHLRDNRHGIGPYVAGGLPAKGISAATNGPQTNASRIENARVENRALAAGARRGIAGVCAAVGATAMDRLPRSQVVGNREGCAAVPRIVNDGCGTCRSKTATTASTSIRQTPP